MAITASVVSSGSRMPIEPLQLVPLQFSGEFLEWAVLFFVLAIVAAAVGARGVAGLSMTAAKWLIILFLVLAIISVLL